MAIEEALVASVVLETSKRMADPQFAQIAIGQFVEDQPQLAHYLSIKATRLGGAQAVMELAFHAEFLCTCLRTALGRGLPVTSLQMLDLASQGDPVARFEARQPALASYIASNLAEVALRTELCRIGLALALAAERGP